MPQGGGSFANKKKTLSLSSKGGSKGTLNKSHPRAGLIAKPKSSNIVRYSNVNKKLTSQNIKNIEESAAVNATNLKLVQATGSMAKEKRNIGKNQKQRKPLIPKSGK